MKNFGIITTGPLKGEPYASDLRQFDLLGTDGKWTTYHLKEKEVVVCFDGGRVILSVQYWQPDDREFDMADNHRTRILDWWADSEESQKFCSALKRTPALTLRYVLQELRREI